MVEENLNSCIYFVHFIPTNLFVHQRLLSSFFPLFLPPSFRDCYEHNYQHQFHKQEVIEGDIFLSYVVFLKLCFRWKVWRLHKEPETAD